MTLCLALMHVPCFPSLHRGLLRISDMVLPCVNEGIQLSEKWLAHEVQNVLGMGYVFSSVVSFLFTLVDHSAGGTQSSVLSRAVACYVLTIPDLSRTCERELMWYTMAQAFPLTFPTCSGPWFKFISEQRCRGIHDYGGRYRFGSGLNAIVDPTTTTSNGGVQVNSSMVITSWSRTLWCGYWKVVTTNIANPALSIFHTCSWGLVPF